MKHLRSERSERAREGMRGPGERDVPATVLAVVEINDPMLLLVVAVFILTFIVVCFIGWRMLVKVRRDGERMTWNLQFGTRLPVSKESFDRIASVTESAVSAPQVEPATRAHLERLDSVRGAFATVYRTLMIAVGIGGLIGGALLMRSHMPGNMNALPGTIILLLALGALLAGLVPGRSVAPLEPLAPELFRQMREKVKVQVITLPTTEVKLERSDVRRISEMLRQGGSVADALRAVYPPYETMDESEKRWLESTVAKYVQEAKPEP